MKQTICILLSAIAISLGCSAKKQTSTFPDGTPISSWFADTTGTEGHGQALHHYRLWSGK